MPRDKGLEELTQRIQKAPAAAHGVFFPHRHLQASPPFHAAAIERIHSTVPYFLLMAFRGAAKSTLFEEAAIIQAICGGFHNSLIVSETIDQACDRLRSIKNELETNETILEYLGPQTGVTWHEAKIVLANGVCIQAAGRGKSLRGMKHLQYRPDFVFLDDIESDESINTPEAIDKVVKWYYSTLIPALARPHRVRIAATPLAPNALCVQLANAQQFETQKVPVYYHSKGTLVSSWPEMFPVEEMLAMRDEYERMGSLAGFGQEFLCEAEMTEHKAFDVTSIPVDASYKHEYQSTFIICDPARTTKATSSLTGYVAASWIDNKLIVWEGTGETHKPSEIIDHLFKLDLKYNPTAIAVERDGLEEFLMEPLRREQLVRNHQLPLEPVRAPKGKLQFIKALQPYIKAGEVILAQPSDALTRQLQNFPSGKLDTLNALAYALRLHPGTPVYSFPPDADRIVDVEALRFPISGPFVLALNATTTETAGAIVATPSYYYPTKKTLYRVRCHGPQNLRANAGVPAFRGCGPGARPDGDRQAHCEWYAQSGRKVSVGHSRLDWGLCL